MNSNVDAEKTGMYFAQLLLQNDVSQFSSPQTTQLKIEHNPFAKGFRGGCNTDHYASMKR